MKISQREIRRKAEEIQFSGVVSLYRSDLIIEEAFGYRDWANEIKNTTATRFGIASGTKGFTALGVARLMDDGYIGLDTLG